MVLWSFSLPASQWGGIYRHEKITDKIASHYRAINAQAKSNLAAFSNIGKFTLVISSEAVLVGLDISCVSSSSSSSMLHTAVEEFDNVNSWALKNNLKIYPSK